MKKNDEKQTIFQKNARKKRERNRVKTEKIIMLATAVMLLSGLTVTGIYLRGNKNRNDSEKEITIDLSGMEKSVGQKAQEILSKNSTQEESMEEASENVSSKTVSSTQRKQQSMDDLDYDPEFYEDSSDEVEKVAIAETPNAEETNKEEVSVAEATTQEVATEQSSQDLPEEQKQEAASVDASKVASLHFSQESTLAWPIVGQVLMNYSMDSTVYFKTLDQYRYQPGMVIAAQVGDTIYAAADALVLGVEQDAALGTTVTMDLGDGYELIYGQLGDIKVKEGDLVETGEVIGFIAEPTKYYSSEGSNLYVQLNKDDTPINPLTLMP